MRLRSTQFIILLAAFGFLGCAAGDDALDDRHDFAQMPPPGGTSTFDVATWNLEWFGHTSLGPADDALQLRNAADIIEAGGIELWGLEEIVNADAFNALVAALPGYDGILADDPQVVDGSAYYHRSEQKVALIYRTDVVTVTDARLVLTEYDHQFAGRPPLQVTLQAEIDGLVQQLVVLVLHAKALTTTDGWERRLDASLALEAYLDANFPSQAVMVIGDFNDDIDTSTKRGSPSPYDNFVANSGNYAFATAALTANGVPTTIKYKDAIDHHLVTDDLMAFYVADSAAVWRVDEVIAGYEDTTSDHLPVMVSYRWGGGSTSQLLVNEILANEPGGSTAGEFIEIVNIGAAPADLSGFSLTDTAGIRHTFAERTTVEPGQVMVVFGGDSAIPAELSAAVAASSGSLGLNNSGDRVSLLDPTGMIVDAVEYGSALASRDGVSMNREIDGAADGAFVLHDTISASLSSPGVRLDGSRW